MWFRRDLRLHDNVALYHTLKAEKPVVPVFIFDKNILDQLEDKADGRVQFIHAALLEMQIQLAKVGSTLETYYGTPKEIFISIIKKYKVENVYTNHDYEPYALERDTTIKELLDAAGINLITFKDHVIFEKGEILKDNKSPYTVFSPYSRKWKAMLNESHLKAYSTSEFFSNFYKQSSILITALEEMGFRKTETLFPSKQLREDIIKKYKSTRDFPGLVDGTSRLGVHLRFGTVSIRELASIAKASDETYLNELIWRDFYQMILWHFPHVGKGKAFRPEYENIEFKNDEREFKLWCEGQTGYPLVDAGMRELNATGFMHNRVRMVVASFLTKHLLIDWRWGEAYFAQKLLDFELASNNGGWQWAAGSGCDAAPYFRIFNPMLQMQKFDKDFAYVKKWVPEFQEFTYTKPIVEHSIARKRAIEVYSKALKTHHQSASSNLGLTKLFSLLPKR
ncbi:MAG TPA: deoxyribodipyrimidine photo-lyase [Segetibacter sp.]